MTDGNSALGSELIAAMVRATLLEGTCYGVKDGEQFVSFGLFFPKSRGLFSR